jgi:hypothetical protein
VNNPFLPVENSLNPSKDAPKKLYAVTQYAFALIDITTRAIIFSNPPPSIQPSKLLPLNQTS